MHDLMLIRSSKNGGNDEREQTRNQLLTETDGFEGNNGVIILTATNRPSPSAHRCRVRDALTAAGAGADLF